MYTISGKQLPLMPPDLLPPRRKPKTLHQFLTLAARAQFPSHNNRFLARMLEKLSERRNVGEGWVERGELAALWPGRKQPGGDFEARRRESGKVTNGITNLREHIDHRLAWLLPHFTLKLEASPKDRAARYRLVISRRDEPWDFVGNEAPNTLPVSFAYRFKPGPRHVAQVRYWSLALGRRMEIEAVREPPQAEWAPRSHRAAYCLARDRFFALEAERFRQENRGQLHDSHVWGIRDLQVSDGDGSATVRIFTERTAFSDLHFLKRHLDEDFPAMRKQGSYREWLRMEQEPRSGFCPPRDALCVGVMILAKKPRPTVFVAKQHAPDGNGRWEPSAAGAAASHYLQVRDDAPDLNNQVLGVVHREVGLKIEHRHIRWLGFARGLGKCSSTAALAVVELDLSVADVLEKFNRRRERDDVEKLHPLNLAAARDWLETIPAGQRGEFLELLLALVAIDQGLAEAL